MPHSRRDTNEGERLARGLRWCVGEGPRLLTFIVELFMICKGDTRLAKVLLAATLVAAASCSSGGYGNPTSPGGSGGPRELNSGDFGPGASFEHRFAAAGTFNYHCVHHAPMTGSVVVSATAPDTLAVVGITSSTTPFPAANVKPGGRVVWNNATNMVHTVTSN